MIVRGFTALMVTLAAVLVVSGVASAQCSMCVTALEQNGGELAAGFNRGIIFLLAMPYLVFASIGAFWYRNRRKRATIEGSSA